MNYLKISSLLYLLSFICSVGLDSGTLFASDVQWPNKQSQAAELLYRKAEGLEADKDYKKALETYQEIEKKYGQAPQPFYEEGPDPEGFTTYGETIRSSNYPVLKCKMEHEKLPSFSKAGLLMDQVRSVLREVPFSLKKVESLLACDAIRPKWESHSIEGGLPPVNAEWLRRTRVSDGEVARLVQEIRRASNDRTSALVLSGFPEQGPFLVLIFRNRKDSWEWAEIVTHADWKDVFRSMQFATK
jgi:hypothetical protein